MTSNVVLPNQREISMRVPPSAGVGRWSVVRVSVVADVGVVQISWRTSLSCGYVDLDYRMELKQRCHEGCQRLWAFGSFEVFGTHLTGLFPEDGEMVVTNQLRVESPEDDKNHRVKF